MPSIESSVAFFHNQKEPTFENPNFNQTYASQSSELKLKYDSEKAEIQFQPILETLNQYFPSLKDKLILEIGGSSGILSRKLQDEGSIVTMLETEELFVKKARERGVNAQKYNGSDLYPIIGSEQFEVIVANRVFEDIVMSEYQAKRLLIQANKHLKSTGIFIIGTQNPDAVWGNVFKIIGFKQEKINSTPWHSYITQVTIYRKKNFVL